MTRRIGFTIAVFLAAIAGWNPQVTATAKQAHAFAWNTDENKVRFAQKHEDGHDHDDHASDEPHHGKAGHKHHEGDEKTPHGHNKHDDEPGKKPHHGEEGHKHKDGDEKDHDAHGHKDGEEHHKNHGDHDKHSEKEDLRKETSETPEKLREEHDDHKAHAPHGDHSEEAHSEKVSLTDAQAREFGIETAVAAKGDFATHLVRPAEVRFDQDRTAHIVSRIPAIARTITASQGDKVDADQLLAILDSQELSEVRADFIAAAERESLMHDIYVREKDLWERKVARLREFLETQRQHGISKIEKQKAAEKVLALGFSNAHLDALLNKPAVPLSEYRLVSPFAGTVVERHITQGEAVSRERQAFVIADLSRVWVDVSVYAQDLAIVRKGQTVVIPHEGKPIAGKIAFVTPNVDETTRTATARIIVENQDGRLRPGMFLQIEIETENHVSVLNVPKTAVQNTAEGKIIFVVENGKFESRPVTTGRENHTSVEIIEGLAPGEVFVKRGAFTLKAQLSKESFGDGHNH